MPDEARLRQLIEEAKTRRLEAFRLNLEQDISKDLCDTLELTYAFAIPEEQPKATFRMQSATWEIWPASIRLLGKSPSEMSASAEWLLVIHIDNGDFHRPPMPREFSTRDELLLLIDKLSQGSGG